MRTETVVIMGGFVVLLWLHAIFFDRVQRVSGLWSRWLPVTDTAVRLRPLFRVVAKVIAVVASVFYLVVLLVYAAG
jgi:hypothetical protein